MNTIDILNKRIAICPDIHAQSYHAITLFDALNSIRTGKYKSQIENVRRLHGLGKSALTGYKSKKKQLPSFIFSGTLFDSRFKFDLYGYTSLLVVDIDKLEHPHTAKEALRHDRHIISVWLSPSGNGLKALLYLDFDCSFPQKDAWIYHEHCAFPQIQSYFSETYGINIDPSGSDIARLCFVSYDPEIHLKQAFEPFHIVCNLSNTRIHKIRWKYYYGSKNVRKALKEQQTVAKLLKKSSDKENQKICSDDEQQCR